MTTSRSRLGSGARRLWVGLSVLSLANVPLPTVDRHPLRHQHGPGQVCALHDHLLWYHPEPGGGSSGESGSVLHWHWSLPSMAMDPADEPSDVDPADVDLSDPDEVAWVASPLSHRGAHWWLAKRLKPRRLDPPGLPPGDAWLRVTSQVVPHRRSPSFSATLTTHAALASWLQRWTC